MNDEISELQKEWRKQVIDKLDVLQTGQKELNDKLNAYISISVNKEEYSSLEDRVRSLEESKVKFIAILTTLQVIGSFIGILIGWAITSFKH